MTKKEVIRNFRILQFPLEMCSDEFFLKHALHIGLNTKTKT